MKKINFAKLNIDKNDLLLLKKVVNTGVLVHGTYTDKFEKLFCKFTKAKYAISISSCTAGLHLSCLALGIGRGDEVIVPAMSHTASAHCVEYTGAKAVFTDINYETGNIKIEDIEKKINKNTKAIIVVHMAGLSADIKNILKIAKKYNLKIIEDCAHSLGSKYGKTHLGNFGSTGVFSFYPTKQLTTGEGGMVITNNKNLYLKIKSLKAFGIDTPPHLRKKPGVYDVLDLGFNYRMTEFQAALGFAQLKRYKANLNIRKYNAKLLVKNISQLSKIYCNKFHDNCSYFIFQIFFEKKKERDAAAIFLKKQKIGFSIHYAKPITSLRYYKNKYNLDKKNYKNAHLYADRSISLPVYNQLTRSEINYLSNTLKEIDNLFKIRSKNFY